MQKYDVFGFPLPKHRNLIFQKSAAGTSNLKWPNGWFKNETPQEMKLTKSKLMEKRRMEFCPHPSYDLDGDGSVSNLDFLIAYRFDKDKDGILDEEERRECIKALKAGYEKNFVMGLDANVRHHYDAND